MEKKLLIKFKDRDKEFNFFEEDFDRIKYYCLNECMGIQFMVSAEFIISLVKNLKSLGIKPPFEENHFLSKESIDFLEKSGELKKMENNFGTKDLKVVLPLAIKQSYNFLHKK